MYYSQLAFIIELPFFKIDVMFSFSVAVFDYMGVSTDLTFMATDEVNTIFCINIPIIDDEAFEVDEEFAVNLINAHPVGEIIDDTSCIKIIDNDSKACGM